jgi:asparagine synthase (glutamine-hydrolysing)
MCGIAGFFNVHTQAPADEAVVRQMNDLQRHRGPDADGTWSDGPVALGHRRLSILDLSERGRQPMASADGRFVIVYNGEVYNYVELRHALEADGSRFRTDTDTEVVLQLFAREGARSLQKLNGMFAFAIWDRVERTLFIARDRVGIKPLYYAETAHGVAFASEIKALLVCPGVKAEVDARLIPTYLEFGYVPGAETAMRGIRKLPPAHWLEISERGTRVERYWDVAFEPDRERTIARTADELHALLLDAVRIHLRSDVPVGVFLSGGLDSSAMVALLSEAGIRNIKTFSVAYDEPGEYDETRYAELVARRFGAEHHVLKLDADRFAGYIPEYVWHMDEPVSEAAGISLSFIARSLREHVVVALSGEGSDEIFGGYDIYRYMRLIERYRRAPEALRERVIAPLAAALGGDKVRKYLQLARLPLEERYRGVSLNEPSRVDGLLTPGLRSLARAHRPAARLAEFYARAAGADTLSRMLYVDLNAWLVDDLLVKADKMTMARSVELRVPFLDHRVVEYAATIPSGLKQRGGDVKWILKRVMAGRLPREILRRKKTGFPTPLAIMFKRDLSDYVRETLLSRNSVDRGYFEAAAVRRLVEEHAAGRRDHHKLLWQLLVLEEWHRRFDMRTEAAA